MKKMKLFATINGLALVVFCGCQKKDTTPVQTDKVSVAISSPVEGQIYRKGDTVKINAAVSYISELHGYELKLINKSNNQELFMTDQHSHSDKYNVSAIWVDTLTSATTLKLELVVEVDHNGNTTTKEINLQSQP